MLLEHCIIPDWPAPANVRALQTTRQRGVSVAPYDSLNLGAHVGDVPATVARNRQLLAALLPSEPVWLNQVHGTAVIDTAAAGCGTPEADACISRHKGAVCVVMTADCLPVLLCDDQGSVVGAVHAGWRGLCGGVIERAVRAMNVAPKSVIAWLGPAIGPKAFEVGEEVRAAFIAQRPEALDAFSPVPRAAASSPLSKGEGAKYLADLYLLARQRLHALGVTRIHGGGFCTYTDRARFFSHRRDGVSGRMGTFIWLT